MRCASAARTVPPQRWRRRAEGARIPAMRTTIVLAVSAMIGADGLHQCATPCTEAGGRTVSRHPGGRQHPRLHAAAERAAAPRRLAVRQGQRRVDAGEVQGMGLGRARSSTSTCCSPRRRSALLELVAPTRSRRSSTSRPSPSIRRRPEDRAAADLQRVLHRRRRHRRRSSTSTTAAPEDYDELERLGISVQRRHRHRALRRFVARHQSQDRGRARRGRLPDLLRSERRRVFRERRCFPTARCARATACSAAASMDLPRYPGDPLTPGVGVVPGAKRLADQRMRRRSRRFPCCRSRTATRSRCSRR